MRLTDEELRRALWLQRRLKLLRLWDRIGRVFCYPWTFYKRTQKRWRDELTIYYNKLRSDDSQKRDADVNMEDVARRFADFSVRVNDQMKAVFQMLDSFGAR